MDIGPRSDSAPNEAAFRLVGLPPLMALTPGATAITVALIDGPIALDRPDLAAGSIRIVSATARAACLQPQSIACTHATYVAGVLDARRDSKVRGICPGCVTLVCPIFPQTAAARETDAIPNAALLELAAALRDVIAADARIINLSIGLDGRCTFGPSWRRKTKSEDNSRELQF